MTTENNPVPLTREDLRHELQHYATKADLAELRAEFKADIGEVKASISDLRAEMKADYGELKSGLVMWAVGLLLGGMAASAAIATALNQLWGS